MRLMLKLSDASRKRMPVRTYNDLDRSRSKVKVKVMSHI